MDREQYKAAKERLEEVTTRLKFESLSPQERENLEKEGRELAEVLMTPWLPYDWGYRILMLVIVAIGVWGLLQGNYLLLLVWLILPLFSPRMIGRFISKLTGFKDLS